MLYQHTNTGTGPDCKTVFLLKVFPIVRPQHYNANQLLLVFYYDQKSTLLLAICMLKLGNVLLTPLFTLHVVIKNTVVK